MELIDTHCHIQVAEFDVDREAVIERAFAGGVSALVVPGIHAADLPGLLRVCASDSRLLPAYGLHPVYLEQHRPEHLQQIEALVAERRPAAIGEIGLDYFVETLDRKRQQALFEAQLRIARDADLPVLLHVRKSHDQVLATLRRIRVRGGIAHAFNGSRQQADQFIALGFKLGFGGVMTYARANKIRRLAAELPLTAMVLETDAPDLAPATHHGERNSPEFLPEILATLAMLRDEDPASVARQTTVNARDVFALSL